MEIKNIHIDKKQFFGLLAVGVLGIILGSVITAGAMHSKFNKAGMNKRMKDGPRSFQKDRGNQQNFRNNKQRDTMMPSQQGNQMQFEGSSFNGQQPVMKQDQQGAVIPQNTTGLQVPISQ